MMGIIFKDQTMDKRQRIARALLGAIRDIDSPALKNIDSDNFQKVALREHLDSLGMVNLIISTEDALRQEFGKDVQILGRGDAFSTGSLNTAGAFIDFLDQIV
jgi:hypothetical protein